MLFGRYTNDIPGIVLDGVPDRADPIETKRFGGRPHSRNMQLQIVAKSSVLCFHLANASEKLSGIATKIPPFVLSKLLNTFRTSVQANSFFYP